MKSDMSDRFKPLLDRPKRHRVETYKGTNHVFRLKINGTEAIEKRCRIGGSAIQLYYWFQDRFFLQGRALGFASDALHRDAKVLEKLDGQYAPKLLNYDGNRLVREMLYGKDFRAANPNEQKIMVSKGLEALANIHSREVVVGLAHMKNLFLENSGNVRWLDFDGVYDEVDLVEAQAKDLVSAVYSTYLASGRNRELTRLAAEKAQHYQSNPHVLNAAAKIFATLEYGRSLWFATRVIPEVHKDIQSIFRGS